MIGFETKSHNSSTADYYKSPEMLSGALKKINRSTDVWSLGVVVYELVDLKSPFDVVNRYIDKEINALDFKRKILKEMECKKNYSFREKIESQEPVFNEDTRKKLEIGQVRYKIPDILGVLINE